MQLCKHWVWRHGGKSRKWLQYIRFVTIQLYYLLCEVPSWLIQRTFFECHLCAFHRTNLRIQISKCCLLCLLLISWICPTLFIHPKLPSLMSPLPLNSINGSSRMMLLLYKLLYFPLHLPDSFHLSFTNLSMPIPQSIDLMLLQCDNTL